MSSTTVQSIRVLVVDDDPLLLGATVRLLESPSIRVQGVSSAQEALALLQSQPIDVLVSDLQMPGMTGIELATAVRRFDLDLPVIFLTGSPSVETASRAFELTAFRYLQKPVPASVLRALIEEAVRLRDLVRARTHGPEEGSLADRGTLVAALSRAVATMTMVFQPIVDCATHRTIGHEALMRTREPLLPHPGAVLEAAEKLGRLHMVGRTGRALVAAVLASRADGGTIFVNLHPSDLADPELYLSDAPLARFASRIVLEITERASLEAVPYVSSRMAELRTRVYRIAVDDLGAGYAGLNYFASLRPDIVKIDMSLTRGVDADPVRAKVVQSLVNLSHELGMLVVAEGVETLGERDTLVEMGCNYLQGYLLARPAAPFVAIEWL